MATITSTGLGTGLNINELVSSLVSAQSAPKTAQLDRLKSTTNSSISAYGKLKSALETFSTSLKELNSASAFSGFKASSSNEAIATVTASNSAVAGTYQLKVTQLASASRASSAALPVGDSFSAGSLKISLGGAEPLTVDIADGSSLQDVRNAINTQLKGKGISANIMSNPGSPEEGARLVLTSTETGAGKDIQVEGLGGGLDALNVNEKQGSYLSRAANAEFELDGVKLSSPSNKVDSAVSGLTFELKKVTSETEGATTVGISANQEGLTASLQKFVDAYNSLVSVTNSLTKVTATEGSTETSAAALTGNSIVRGLTNTLRSELNKVAEGAGVGSLYDLGISTSRTGTLEIDKTRMTEALEKNADGLVDFFTKKDTGLISRLDKQITEYTKYNGIIQTETSTLNNTLSDISKQREAHAARMATLETSLLNKFNNMDGLVAQLNGTGNSLLSSLESLNNSLSKK
ncbi:flagellar filament capping protein FliD [Pseudomonas sp. PDM11]|uniref:flagellar filament capping protein FliD n=1 Tax=Pseudomonas sp. PDM11 TaxID=2769309 RepID=UPI00177D8B65|nr:flagellar filament capping protein FliD [Pseudomonas sp. PDM11]MBD9398219.1 flagellar filament capping protein FliD [Pseudomonas sp. PDM11]